MTHTGTALAEAALPVTWLLLDVGGVLELVDDDSWPAAFTSDWEERLALAPGSFRSRLRALDLPDAARRTGVDDEYWRIVGEAVHADAPTLAAMRADFWDRYCGTADDELLGALAGLRHRVGLAILSNSADGAREQEERRFGFSSLFDPICYSHEIGATKPEPRAFRIALERMRAESGEVLFIDDHAENIDAARRLGLRAHLHTSTVETLRIIAAAVG